MQMLKVQSCKLYDNKYMIALIQITNTEMFAAVLVFKLLSRKVLCYKQKRQWKLLKSRLLFKKIANFTVKLVQSYKYLECEIFSIILTHVSDHLSVLFRFA